MGKRINFILQNPPKPVARVDDQGNIIMIYPSQTDAASCTGADQSRISKACRGKINNLVNGHRFQAISLKEYRRLKAAGIRCSE